MQRAQAFSFCYIFISTTNGFTKDLVPTNHGETITGIRIVTLLYNLQAELSHSKRSFSACMYIYGRSINCNQHDYACLLINYSLAHAYKV